eukprot:6699715-Ditylum_brightwellii.AAC.1
MTTHLASSCWQCQTGLLLVASAMMWNMTGDKKEGHSRDPLVIGVAHYHPYSVISVFNQQQIDNAHHHPITIGCLSCSSHLTFPITSSH